MATLTIRDLDDSLKQDLRLRAAQHSRSMEEEVRQILRAALRGAPPDDGYNLGERIRARFADMGGVDLEIAPREMPRDPPNFDDLAFDPPKLDEQKLALPKRQKLPQPLHQPARKNSSKPQTRAQAPRTKAKPPLGLR
jgi:antitoxin FitA